jgi:hypothetical protein
MMWLLNDATALPTCGGVVLAVFLVWMFKAALRKPHYCDRGKE